MLQRFSSVSVAGSIKKEGIKGSLEVGKLADLVVLGSDITAIDPFRIIETKIERTMVGGHWVYES